MSRQGALWVQGVLIAFVCLWSAALVFQNVGVIAVLREDTAYRPFLPATFKIAFALSTMKAVLVMAAGFYFLRYRRRHAAAIFSFAVLYGFPLGLFIDPWLGSLLPPADPWKLISLSALLSYLAVGAIVALELIGERRTSPD